MKLNHIYTYLHIIATIDRAHTVNYRSIEMFMLIFMLSVSECGPTELLNACTWGAVARSRIIISGLIRSLVRSLCRGWYENCYKKGHTKGHYKMIQIYNIQIYTNMIKQKGSKDIKRIQKGI